jgi:hypothetical protein
VHHLYTRTTQHTEAPTHTYTNTQQEEEPEEERADAVILAARAAQRAGVFCGHCFHVERFAGAKALN